jgi:hypothetical protein
VQRDNRSRKSAASPNASPTNHKSFRHQGLACLARMDHLPKPSTTAEEIARWLSATVTRTGHLYQFAAVLEVERRFGVAFTYENRFGGRSFHRKVLAAFRELSGDSVVWEPANRLWRLRSCRDIRGRKQPRIPRK